jgi:hypothetical protein
MTGLYAHLIPAEVRERAKQQLERIQSGRGPEMTAAREHLAAMPKDRRAKLEREWENRDG